MSRLFSEEAYGVWVKNNGKTVTLDGVQHVLRVTVYTATYPTISERITVHAEPKNKGSKYYRDEKQKLGDDWSVDVLESDPKVTAEVLSQLQQQEDNRCPVKRFTI